MAKATRHGGVSFTEHELSDEQPPVTIRRAMLGGDSGLAVDGSSSQEYSERQQSEDEKQQANLQKPAPDAENPSVPEQRQGKDSSVSTTTGAGQKTDQESPDYSEWTYKDLQAECKVRDLNATGKAEELVARLEDDDAQRSTEDITDEDDDFA